MPQVCYRYGEPQKQNDPLKYSTSYNFHDFIRNRYRSARSRSGKSILYEIFEIIVNQSSNISDSVNYGYDDLALNVLKSTHNLFSRLCAYAPYNLNLSELTAHYVALIWLHRFFKANYVIGLPDLPKNMKQRYIEAVKKYWEYRKEQDGESTFWDIQIG